MINLCNNISLGRLTFFINLILILFYFINFFYKHWIHLAEPQA